MQPHDCNRSCNQRRYFVTSMRLLGPEAPPKEEVADPVQTIRTGFSNAYSDAEAKLYLFDF